MIHTLTERHLLPMSTPATGLTGIGRIDFEQLVASFFRFALQLGKEHAPCRVTDRFRQTMIVHHPVDLQVFDTDHAKGVDDLAAVLMGEVLPTPCNALMDTSHNLAMLAPLRRALGKFAVFALHFGQRLFFSAKETGVFDLLCIRESCEGFESHINPNCTSVLRQAFGFHLTRETGIPFASTALADRARLGGPFEGAMEHHLDLAHLGHDKPAIFDVAATWHLWKCDGVVTLLAFESGIAGVLTSLAAPKKGFHGQVDTNSHILQHLGVHVVQGRALVFQERVGGLLLVAGQAFAGLLVGIPTLLKQMVIEPATFFKLVFQEGDLLFRRVNPILKHFVTHVTSICLIRAIVKGQRCTPPKTKKGTRLISLGPKPKALRRGLVN